MKGFSGGRERGGETGRERYAARLSLEEIFMLTRAYTRSFTRNESIKHNLHFSARPQLHIFPSYSLWRGFGEPLSKKISQGKMDL